MQAAEGEKEERAAAEHQEETGQEGDAQEEKSGRHEEETADAEKGGEC